MDKPQFTGALAGITNGKMIRPIYGLISGLPGVGKTTLTSQAPNPIYLGLESGTYQLNVSRFPKAETLAEFLEQLRGVAVEKHPFKTIVLDSIDALEPLIWKQVCSEGKVESISEYGGGYGQGYLRAMEIWRSILHDLGLLSTRFHVLLTGHVMVKTFQDPNLASGYDRYQLKVNEKAAAVVRESVDLMLFCTFKTDLIRDRKSKEVRALTDGTRVMYTEFRPAFLEAKNRFGLPFEMPLAWKPLATAIRAFYDPPPAPAAQPPPLEQPPQAQPPAETATTQPPPPEENTQNDNA